MGSTPSPRRLVVVGAHEGTKGAAPHTDRLLPALVRAGYEIEFWGWDRGGVGTKHHSVAYRYLLRRGRYASPVRTLILLPVWWCAVVRKLLRDRPGFVMALDFEAGLPSALVAGVCGFRLVYNVRDNFSMRRRYTAWVRGGLDALDRWIVGRATSVIFPDESRVFSRIPTGKVSIVRNCSPDYTAGPIEWPMPDGTLVVGAIGYLRASRGIELLLDAAERLPFLRVIAAGPCPEVDLLDRLRTTVGCEYYGLVFPAVAAELLGKCHLAYTLYDPSIPINRVAISNKWSDAMAVGRPILINSEVAKAPSLVELGVALCVERYTLEALLALLNWVHESPGVLERMGHHSRQVFEDGYSWAVMEERLLRLLEECGAYET